MDLAVGPWFVSQHGVSLVFLMSLLSIVSEPAKADTKAVCRYLTSQGMKQYSAGVSAQEIDGTKLLQVTYEDLLSLGFSEHHATLLMNNIRRMQQLVALDDDLPVKKALCKMEYTPQYVEVLDLTGQPLGKNLDQLRALVLGLETNALLKKLILRGCSLDDRCADLVGALVANNGAQLTPVDRHRDGCIQDLCLANNRLSHNCGTEDAARSIATALSGNATLHTLDLSQNCLKEGGAAAFAQFLLSPGADSQLLGLDLSGNRITSTSAKELVDGLVSKSCPVKVLALAKNYVFDSTAAEALTAFAKLRGKTVRFGSASTAEDEEAGMDEKERSK